MPRAGHNLHMHQSCVFLFVWPERQRARRQSVGAVFHGVGTK